MDKLATTPAFVTRHQLTALRHWRTSPKQNGRKESVDWLLRMELALVIHASRLEPLTPTILRNRITAMWATPSTPTLDVTMGSKTWIPGLYRSDKPGHLLLVEVDPVQVSCVICKDVSCPPPCSGFDRCGLNLPTRTTMKLYTTGLSADGRSYVYRTKRERVLARDLTKRDAQLIARALNLLAEKDGELTAAIRYIKRYGQARP